MSTKFYHSSHLMVRWFCFTPSLASVVSLSWCWKFGLLPCFLFFFNPIFTMCLFVHTPTHAFTSVLSSSLFILILLLYLSRIYTDPIGLLYLILFLHKLTFLGPTGGGGCSPFNTFTCDTFARNVCVIVEGNICCRPLFMGFYRPKKALKSKVYLLSTFFFFPFGVCVTVSTDNPLEYTHTFKFTFGSSFIGKI